MSMMESACNRRNSSSKWMALGMMQRAEQVRDIAEMLDATMEDLSAQMENLDEKMDLLAEATEAIQEKMEEIVKSVNRQEEGGEGRADEFILKYAERGVAQHV